MRLTGYFIAATLALGPWLFLGCGGGEEAWEPTRETEPAVWCFAHWKSGPKGSFSCNALGSAQGRVAITRDTFRLVKVCVSDPRLTKYGFNDSETAAIEATGEPPNRCAQLPRIARLPQTCLCEPPPGGGDCTPPTDGFSCLAAGYVSQGETATQGEVR